MLLAVAQVHPILRWDRRSSWPLRAQVEWGLGSVGATRRVSGFSPAGGHICSADDFSEQPRCFSSVATRQQRPPGILVRTRQQRRRVLSPGPASAMLGKNQPAASTEAAASEAAACFGLFFCFTSKLKRKITGLPQNARIFH